MIPARYQGPEAEDRYDPLEGYSDVWCIDTLEGLEELLENIKPVVELGVEIALDFETDGINPAEESPAGKGRLATAQVGWYKRGEEGFLAGDDPTLVWMDLRNNKMARFFLRILSLDAKWVIHNFQFEYHIAANHGVTLDAPWADTLQMSRLEDPERMSHSLDGAVGLCNTVLGIPGYMRPTTKQTLGTFKIKKDGTPGLTVELLSMSKLVSDEEMKPYQVMYAVEDVSDSLGLYYMLRKRLEAIPWDNDSRGMWGFWEEYQRPYLPIVAKMERQGIPIDHVWAEHLLSTFQEKMRALDQKLWAWAGCEVNWGSWQQKQWVLFGTKGVESQPTKKCPPLVGHGLPIPPAKRGKENKISTDKAAISWVLEEVAVAEPGGEDWQAIKHYQERQRLASLEKGTLKVIQAHGEKARLRGRTASGVRGYDELLEEYLYIHGQLNPLAARTGRFTANNPNLQQVPSRTYEGKMIRAAFISEPGSVLVVADYSQLELRILAFYIVLLFGDYQLADELEAGDLHQKTADDLSKIMGYIISRDLAKTINFGIIYGISSRKISADTGMPLEEAERLLAGYFESRPGVRKYMEWAKDYAKAEGFAPTILGRKRFLHNINLEVNWGCTRAEFKRLSRGEKGAIMRRLRPVFEKISQDERRAMNTPIQGSAQDIMEMAMLEMDPDEELKSYNYRMCLVVHDEIIGMCDTKYRTECTRRVAYLMQHAIPKEETPGVTFYVDGFWGMSWAEAKDGGRWPCVPCGGKGKIDGEKCHVCKGDKALSLPYQEIAA